MKRNKNQSEHDPKQQETPSTEEPTAEVEATSVPEVSATDEHIAELERDLATERDQRLRVLADFQNYRRRTDEQRAEIGSLAIQDFVGGLLPIMDNLERAMVASADNETTGGIVEGVSLIHRQLMELLQRYGVAPIEAVGCEFDPNLHEAVMRVDAEDVPDNTVIEELVRGYAMGPRVIRPSVVKVAKS